MSKEGKYAIKFYKRGDNPGDYLPYYAGSGVTGDDDDPLIHHLGKFSDMSDSIRGGGSVVGFAKEVDPSVNDDFAGIYDHTVNDPYWQRKLLRDRIEQIMDDSYSDDDTVATIVRGKELPANFRELLNERPDVRQLDRDFGEEYVYENLTPVEDVTGRLKPNIFLNDASREKIKNIASKIQDILSEGGKDISRREVADKLQEFWEDSGLSRDLRSLGVDFEDLQDYKYRLLDGLAKNAVQYRHLVGDGEINPAQLGGLLSYFLSDYNILPSRKSSSRLIVDRLGSHGEMATSDERTKNIISALGGF